MELSKRMGDKLINALDSQRCFEFYEEGQKCRCQKQWKTVANKVLKETGDDAKAKMIANAAVKKRRKK